MLHSRSEAGRSKTACAAGPNVVGRHSDEASEGLSDRELQAIGSEDWKGAKIVASATGYLCSTPSDWRVVSLQGSI